MKYMPGITVSKRINILKKREYEKDILCNYCKGGAWTVALVELEKHDYSGLEYTTELQTYSIAMEDVIKYGFQQTLGGVKKLIIPLTYWTKSNGITPNVTFKLPAEQMQLI
jgi:hypothetical protein